MASTWPQKIIHKYGTKALQFIEDNIDLIETHDFEKLFEKNDLDIITRNICHILDDCNIEWLSYVTSIPPHAYWGRRDLEELIIPNNVTAICTEAFDNCQRLKRLVLPSTIKDIGNKILIMTNLTEIEFKGTKKEWADIWFSSSWNKGSHIGTVKCSDGIVKEVILK